MRRLRAFVPFLSLLSVLGYLMAPAIVLADNGPTPPCSASQSDPGGLTPQARVWHEVELGAGWSAPACLGWSAGAPSAVLSLSGAFRFAGTTNDLLTRFGAVSAMTGMRYWSVGDRNWRELITSSAALEGPRSSRHRADFTAAEMLKGGDFYFEQSDSRSSAPVTYRMRLLQLTPDRLAIEIENVSAVRLLLLSVYRPGDLKTTYFLDRTANEQWNYYSLSSVRESGVGGLTGNHDSSYINRAVALYRHVAGIPTDQEPPLALQ